eukprot:5733956-Lingulodinium_polyedra.AAC.1
MSDANRALALRKTLICKYWAQGRCKRGANCSFAHGEQELCRVPYQFKRTRSLQDPWADAK